MELADLAMLPIVDCHVHYQGDQLDRLEAMMEAEARAGTERVALLSISDLGRPNTNAATLYAKYRYPERVYWFASPDYAVLTEEVDPRLTLSLPAHVDRLSRSARTG